MRKPRQAKPKQVAYEFIDPTSVGGHPIYSLLTTLVSAHHEDIAAARIALAWNLNWGPDADGRVKVGMCRRASDLDRELAAFDFVILLRRSFWLDSRVTDEQRTAVLDHELTHCAVVIDKRTDEPAIDERGRKIYRLRRHDIEEFSSIVARYGAYTADIERLAAALRESQVPFKPCSECQENPGWIRAADAAGVMRASRCPCWIRWSQHRADVDAEEAIAS